MCTCIYIDIYINICISVARWLSPSHRPLACPLARSLSLTHSHSLNLSLPFSPSTVSSSGEETHLRLSSLSSLNFLLLERALIFPLSLSPLFLVFSRLNRKKILIEKDDENSMIRMWWWLIGRSIARWRCRWELRASSRIRCICYSSCLRSMDSMRTMMFFLLLLLLLFLFSSFFLLSGCFLLLNFLLFFVFFLLIIYANLGRSFTVHHRAACRSRENGEGIGNHLIRVLT